MCTKMQCILGHRDGLHERLASDLGWGARAAFINNDSKFELPSDEREYSSTYDWHHDLGTLFETGS